MLQRVPNWPGACEVFPDLQSRYIPSETQVRPAVDMQAS